MARVLIAGCGWLGTALGLALAQRGDEVWGLRRSAARLPLEIEAIEADLDDPGTLGCLPLPLDAVVYAAAPEASDPAAYQRVYVRGLGNVIAAVAGDPVGGDPQRGDPPSGLDTGHPRLILLSSTSVYGQTAGEWVDEGSPTEPEDFRGRIVLEGEATLDASGLPATALRLGGLYGPGRDAMIDAVRTGRAGVMPGSARFTNRIHRDDAVGVLLHLLALPAAELAPIYVGVDREPADRNDVVRWLAQRLGVEVGEEEKGATGRVLRRDTNKQCSSERLVASGYHFRFPSYREGYASLLETRAETSSAPTPD